MDASSILGAEESGGTRTEGIARLDGPVSDVGHPDYIVYHYLIPCIERAGRSVQGRLVDIGCGNKPYRSLFPGVQEYVGCDVVQSSRSVVDVIAPSHAIPLPDGGFDVVLSTQTLEHVADPVGLLKEAFRMLRPGGVFFLSCPMYWPLHEEPHDYHRFTRHGLTNHLRHVGFENVRVTENGGAWSVSGLALIHALPTREFRMKRRIVRAINRLFLWLDARYFCPRNTSNYFVEASKPPRNHPI